MTLIYTSHVGAKWISQKNVLKTLTDLQQPSKWYKRHIQRNNWINNKHCHTHSHLPVECFIPTRIMEVRDCFAHPFRATSYQFHYERPIVLRHNTEIKDTTRNVINYDGFHHTFHINCLSTLLAPLTHDVQGCQHCSVCCKTICPSLAVW